ncbi:hypothetical protein LXL04_012416 [Taraxacum kok-saghyz]
MYLYVFLITCFIYTKVDRYAMDIQSTPTSPSTTSTPFSHQMEAVFPSSTPCRWICLLYKSNIGYLVLSGEIIVLSGFNGKLNAKLAHNSSFACVDFRFPSPNGRLHHRRLLFISGTLSSDGSSPSATPSPAPASHSFAMLVRTLTEQLKIICVQQDYEMEWTLKNEEKLIIMEFVSKMVIIGKNIPLRQDSGYRTNI